MVEISLPNRRATRMVARRLCSELRAGDAVFLEGPLGAGKTFFVRAACRALGVPSRVPVQSPTFGLVHELEGRLPIVHADLYRLASVDEVWELGLREAMADGVAFIEWGERFRDALAHDAVQIAFERAGGVRRVIVTGFGERGEALERALRDLAA